MSFSDTNRMGDVTDEYVTSSLALPYGTAVALFAVPTGEDWVFESLIVQRQASTTIHAGSGGFDVNSNGVTTSTTSWTEVLKGCFNARPYTVRGGSSLCLVATAGSFGAATTQAWARVRKYYY